MGKRGVQRKDLTGQRFTRLVVLAYSYTDPRRSAYWMCLCDCGAEKVVPGKGLLAGTSQSCGCLGKERRAAAVTATKTTHGASRTRTYRIWTNMHSRCSNPNFTSYKWYGARGIKVCERWASFQNFQDDMGTAPDGLSLDRIDVNGDYEPSNCRWVTQTEQCNSRRNNRIYEWQGERLTQAQLAKRYGIRQNLLADRVGRGWSLERALTEPTKTATAADRGVVYPEERAA